MVNYKCSLINNHPASLNEIFLLITLVFIFDAILNQLSLRYIILLSHFIYLFLQFFSETAHNPVSNQLQKQEIYSERKRPQRPLVQLHTQTVKPGEFYVDAVSWKSLQESAYGSVDYNRLGSDSYKQQKQQRSADNLLYASPREVLRTKDKPEEFIDDPNRRPRAQPQVPLYRKMGRRASEGSTFSNKELYPYEFLDNFSIATESSDMVVGGTKMKGSAKVAYPDTSSHVTRGNENMQTFTYPNAAGCRLSLDGGGRRESSSSLTSSVADGSKDSLSSYDSVSTLTGQDTDDSVIMSRLRKNLQKKEEFLRRPSHPVEPPTIQREFYGRPKKLEKPTWPPNEPVRQESPSRTVKPVHQNLQRVKSDIDTERDLGMQSQNDRFAGGAVNNVPLQKGASSPKDWHLISSSEKIKEATPAPDSLNNPGQMNGAASIQDEDRR